jgi:hypothetical protein
MKTKDELRRDYIKSQAPATRRELFKIVDAFNAGLRAGEKLPQLRTKTESFSMKTSLFKSEKLRRDVLNAVVVLACMGLFFGLLFVAYKRPSERNFENRHDAILAGQ